MFVMWGKTLAFLGLVAAILWACPAETTPITRCTRPPPGISKMALGVDITELDLVPLTVTASNGYKMPLIDYTCNEHKVWVAANQTRYDVPDQVSQITTLPGGWASADVSIYKTYQEIRRKLIISTGGSGNIWKFSFSASGSYQRLQHTITNTSHYVEEVSAFDSASRADFIPSWVLQLGRFAQMYVDRRMTGNYRTNREPYDEFIQHYGTHYFQHANFGGYIKLTLETNTDYYYGKQDRQVSAQAKASFMNIVSAHGGVVSGSTTVDETFRRKSTNTVRYFGGNTNLLATNGIPQWQPTVAQNPWLFSGQLTPISDLISDPVKKEALEQATYDYVMRRYLEELVRLIHAGKTKAPDAAILTTLLNRVRAMQNKDFLVESEVEGLLGEVESQLMVPPWFTEHTNLCYRWYPDGDGGQCGDGESRLLCARPNAMTPAYRDDTDGRWGGCRMSWGIQSSGQPSWFNAVQVCYRWHPDFPNGQCGGGAARELCSIVNAWTPYYRDDTDGRGGGCQMSWRLVVPSSAPVWLATAKLCFSWYPDGNGGQCGPAQSRDMCATANEWTPYYRDDTDGRGGGCRMKWGLETIM